MQCWFGPTSFHIILYPRSRHGWVVQHLTWGYKHLGWGARVYVICCRSMGRCTLKIDQNFYLKLLGELGKRWINMLHLSRYFWILAWPVSFGGVAPSKVSWQLMATWDPTGWESLGGKKGQGILPKSPSGLGYFFFSSLARCMLWIPEGFLFLVRIKRKDATHRNSKAFMYGR